MIETLYGVVGSGNVAKHFSKYLSELGLPYKTWNRQKDTLTVTEKLNPCTHILILISDDNIEVFLNKNPNLLSKTIVHFSGSLTTDLANGAHPLMSFSDKLYDLSTYKKIPFIIEEPNKDLKQLLPHFPNPFFAIKKEQKSYYHALCSLAGNYTVLLWQKFLNEMEDKFKLPPQYCYHYMKQVFENILENPNTALTGPLKRGDSITIESHLKAFDNDDYKDVYAAFVQAYQQKEGKNVLNH